MNFNEKNSHYRDAQLNFDEASHTYTVNGEEYISVTTLVDKCFEQFDADYWAKKKAPSLGMTPQAVKEMWQRKGDEAAALGSKLHNMIERYYLGLPNESDPAYSLFKQFAGHHVLTPYRTEWAIFDEDHKVAGTLDFLNYENGVFSIYDWKRSNKVIAGGRPEKISRYGKRALRPISHIPDTTYWHYALQVSIYRYILETKYGINVQDGHLAVFHPDYDTPYLVDVPYLRDEVVAILNNK